MATLNSIIRTLKSVHLLDAQDVTTHASFYSAYLDRQGTVGPVRFKINFGTVTNTDANNKVTPSVVVAEDGETATASASYAAAASGDLVGSTLATVDGAADDQTTMEIEYCGNSRYVAILFTVVSAGANPDHIPVAVDADVQLADSSNTVTTGTIV